MADMPTFALIMANLELLLPSLEIIGRSMNRNFVSFVCCISEVDRMAFRNEGKTNKYGFHFPANVYSEFF